MTTRDFVFQGEVFTCRIVKDNEGCDLIIGGLKFLDALQPQAMDDPMEGFASKKAQEIYDEIFFFIDEQTLALPDEQLIEALKVDNEDYFILQRQTYGKQIIDSSND